MRVEARLLATVLAIAACVVLGATARAQDPRPPAAARAEPALQPDPPLFPVDLQTRLKDVRLFESENGEVSVLTDGAGLVPADIWVRNLHAAQFEQSRRGFLYQLFNITKPWGFAWIAIGFAGQALFTLRMVLQWWASEKEKRSVVPVAFWWGSLFGGILLFVYFCWRKDIVGIVGQSTGIFVYARNLVLIHRATAAATA